MVSHYPVEFGGHRHFGNGDMFLVGKEENSRYSRFNPPLLFISKAHGLKEHGLYTNSDPRHPRTKQQLDKYLITTFASPFKTTDGKEKEKIKKGNYKAFCVTSKRKKKL